jgi:hypothetical protein
MSRGAKEPWKAYEGVILTLPALSLVGLALLYRRSGYHSQSPSALWTFIKSSASLRGPDDVLTMLLTLMCVTGVIASLTLFLQYKLDEVPPPFEKPGANQE